MWLAANVCPSPLCPFRWAQSINSSFSSKSYFWCTAWKGVILIFFPSFWPWPLFPRPSVSLTEVLFGVSGVFLSTCVALEFQLLRENSKRPSIKDVCTKSQRIIHTSLLARKMSALAQPPPSLSVRTQIQKIRSFFVPKSAKVRNIWRTCSPLIRTGQTTLVCGRLLWTVPSWSTQCWIGRLACREWSSNLPSWCALSIAWVLLMTVPFGAVSSLTSFCVAGFSQSHRRTAFPVFPLYNLSSSLPWLRFYFWHFICARWNAGSRSPHSWRSASRSLERAILDLFSVPF